MFARKTSIPILHGTCPVLQRKCSCSGVPRWKRDEQAEGGSAAKFYVDGRCFSAAFGHNFSRIPIQPAESRSRPQLDGLALNVEADEEGISLDDTPQPAPAPGVTPPNPPPPPAPKPKPAPAPAPKAAACPTKISVAEVYQAPLADANVAAGFRTGFGGVAKMEVSDPGGKDWAGTAIHENIKSATNTCDPKASACPNTGGEGGAKGSTFNVGDATSAFGFSLPAAKNCFYDLHLYGEKTSILHANKLAKCEQTCMQTYDCGGTVFGPTFTIKRSMTPDRITSDKTAVDVTQVALDKS